MEGRTSDAKRGKFGQEEGVVNTIKSFGQVAQNSNGVLTTSQNPVQFL